LSAALPIWATLFVGTHFLLSHPLRAPLVARLGLRGFLALYSAVAFATLVPMVLARRAAGPEAPLWAIGEWSWVLASVLMLLASVLLAGSFVGNPAMQTMQRPGASIGRPAGVLRWTRHPMMWSFALWSLSHLLVHPEPGAVVIAVAILVLALGGSAAQDRRKRRQLGRRWTEWERATSFVPFGRGLSFPGWFPLLGGIAFFLLATWLHPMPVGLWQWLA
jgi:uncharacterized membrane protein